MEVGREGRPHGKKGRQSGRQSRRGVKAGWERMDGKGGR